MTRAFASLLAIGWTILGACARTPRSENDAKSITVSVLAPLGAPLGALREVSVIIKNLDSKPVAIVECKTTCGCLQPRQNGGWVIAAGESVTVPFIVKGLRLGESDQSILLKVESHGETRWVSTPVTVHVSTGMEVAPTVVRGVGMGSERLLDAATMRIRLDSPASIQWRVSSDLKGTQFSVEARPSTEGYSRAAVSVTLPEVRGVYVGHLTIEAVDVERETVVQEKTVDVVLQVAER